MSHAYFDCFAGISGDMTVGALLDLGVPLEFLHDELAKVSLPAGSYELALDRVTRQGIAACKFSVTVQDCHTHRHYSHIAEMIEKSRLSLTAREKAQRIFLALAEAEAKVHGVDVAEVHFHEVGAVDSIVDIVAAAICLDYLQVRSISVSPLPLGGGSIKSAHGVLPIPAPATLELMRGLPVHTELGAGERVTPTGAAILAALTTEKGPADMVVGKVGYGAGDRDFPDAANVLRVVLGERSADSLQHDQVVVAESHIDDCSPEILGHVLGRLLDAGALDAVFSPLQMKKNRPGTKLTFIAPTDTLSHLARIVLSETSAIGLRYYTCSRLKLDRSLEFRDTSLGKVQIKVIREGGEILRIAPEYEECRKVAESTGMPLQEVYRIIEKDIDR